MTFPIKISIIVEKEINKNGNKIQARYYWEYVINLRETDQKLKDIIAKKILSGPNF